jgi:Protein of unknown function (DUF4058)
MPSPFPGMDPFIESQSWEDFHTSFMSAIRDAIVDAVRPNYTVKVEQRIYLETHDPSTPVQSLVADAALYKTNRAPSLQMEESEGGLAVMTETEIEIKTCTIPYIEEHRETFLTIRRGKPSEVVTVIELLSPTNKRKGTDGRLQYTEKSSALLKTSAHFVELDLLRNGERTLVSEPPSGDYFAMISRAERRPNVEVYGWRLLSRLPVIPIPLAGKDPDVKLDLQQAFTLVYDRAGYDYALDYQQPVIPTLTEAEAAKLKAKLPPVQPKG